MSNVKNAINIIKEKRRNITEGRINSIPQNFKRFSKYFVGIEKSSYYIVTGQTKAGKSQLTAYMFLFTPIMYAYNNPDKAKVKIFYFPLEESKERIIHRFISYLLYEYYGLRISPRDLRSSNNQAIPEDIIQKIESPEMQSILSFFEEVVVFSEAKNPTGIKKDILEYVKENGKTEYEKTKIRNEVGELVEVDRFFKYTPNNPNEYVIAIVDHISLLTQEKGYSKKENIDKLSQFFIELRDKYQVSPVVIQQQASVLSADNLKMDLVRPTRDGLADSKYTALDCNYLIGIFSPYSFKIPEYPQKGGYDIRILRDQFRTIELLLSRDGSPSSIVGLEFKGDVCDFKELPLPETNEMQLIYNKYKSIQNK